MIHLKNIEFLSGQPELNFMPLPTFDDSVCEFVSELSAKLLQSPLSRMHPDLSALAFWARRANLQKIKQNFGEYSNRTGRGLCFHITPSNIPINFAFSYLFSLLAGNANIVRMPSKNFPQIDAFCDIFNQVVKHYPDIACRTALIRYPRDNETTAQLCAISDARMIWGGDTTIALIKSMPAPPRCVDITFADRFSVAIIDGHQITDADDTQILRLANNFYNDTYLMDQNACSSPQLILWTNDSDAARNKFWDAVYNVAIKKYDLQGLIAIDKYTQMCEESISSPNISRILHRTNLMYRAEIAKLNSDIINHRGKGGFFYEYSLSDISELINIITEKFQTITYFGIDGIKLRQKLIENHVRGIDRIVPIGSAMNIDYIWDGHNLVSELSRIISVE